VEARDARVVHVATAPNETFAMMWRDILRDAGIVALVKGGGAGYSFGHNLLNEQYIMVRDDQAEQARQILADLDETDGLVLWETS
jgi:hypothetical protein